MQHSEKFLNDRRTEMFREMLILRQLRIGCCSIDNQ